MQSVLFTVFRTDSVEKINIWVATRENLSSGRLKSAYSATENSYNIEKDRVASCVACLLCLFLTVLWSTIMVFSSHTHFLTTIIFPVNNNKALIRLHRFSHVTKSGFLEARSLIVDITYLSVY